MPPHHGGGRHDLHRLPPAWPDIREQHPEQPIDRTEARSFRSGPLQHSELMPQSENFHCELYPRVDGGPKRGQEGDEQRSHSVRERYQSRARNRNRHNTYGIFSRRQPVPNARGRPGPALARSRRSFPARCHRAVRCVRKSTETVADGILANDRMKNLRLLLGIKRRARIPEHARVMAACRRAVPSMDPFAPHLVPPGSELAWWRDAAPCARRPASR